jgi:hypothetical protein
VVRCFNLKLLNLYVKIDNLRPGRVIRGKQRPLGDVESQHLQDCNPRLCRLRTEGLVHVSKY